MSDKESQTCVAEISALCKETQTSVLVRTGEVQTQTRHDLVDSETQTSRGFPVGIEINSVVQFI